MIDRAIADGLGFVVEARATNQPANRTAPICNRKSIWQRDPTSGLDGARIRPLETDRQVDAPRSSLTEEPAPPGPGAGKPLELSVVIPCLNEARTLGICIRKAQGSLERLGLTGEVIVADNGSTDGSQAIAEE